MTCRDELNPWNMFIVSRTYPHHPGAVHLGLRHQNSQLTITTLQFVAGLALLSKELDPIDLIVMPQCHTVHSSIISVLQSILWLSLSFL